MAAVPDDDEPDVEAVPSPQGGSVAREEEEEDLDRGTSARLLRPEPPLEE